MNHGSERGTRHLAWKSCTRCASLGIRYRRPRTANRPPKRGRPAVRSSYHTSTGRRCGRQEQLVTLHLLISLLSASVLCFLTAGRSTMEPYAGRRMCCRERRDQSVGVAVLKRAAKPVTPTFSAGRTSCRRYYSPGNRPDSSQVRLESRPCTSADSAFRGSCGLPQSGIIVKQREPSGRPRMLSQRLFS
jgi:hypothetical protein